jgi:endonuclease/exonuclease/phosphatase (EEP) superfamily protein YafD
MRYDYAMAILILGVLTALLAAATAAPFVRLPHGSVRVCAFPRLQILALAAFLIVLIFVFLPLGAGAFLLLGVLLVVLVVQTAYCLPFTSLWRVQSLPWEGGRGDDSVVRIIASNVKMSNRRFDELVSVLTDHKPDIAVLMEVDNEWLEALAPLKDDLPHTVEQPQDNTYGIALFSRLPLIDPQVRFKLVPVVPSICTTVALPNGDQFRLHVLHPEPPVPYEDTLGRDGELLLTAKEVEGDPMPAIVTGDLNDVAWSRTTRRFQRLSGLLDPRVGRGFFNSFDARYPFLRWPLDHLFHDPRFRLAGLERLKNIGSDHFPMYFALVLTETERTDESPDEPEPSDHREAREVIDGARRLGREPIGSDWED